MPADGRFAAVYTTGQIEPQLLMGTKGSIQCMQLMLDPIIKDTGRVSQTGIMPYYKLMEKQLQPNAEGELEHLYPVGYRDHLFID